MVDSVLFEQEWFMELDLFHRLLYIYLLTRTTNSGMFDVNCRRMSFDMGRKVTEQDIFGTYGNRIARVPGHPSKGIFPSFISFCWTKGKEIDIEKNRVVKGIVSELARYGLTIEAVERMSSYHPAKIVERQEELSLEPVDEPARIDVEAMFEKFWSRYPARKDGKKGNLARFSRAVLESKDPEGEFVKIMNGLQGWIECRKWTKDGGAYIDSMSKFFNRRFWELEPDNAGRDNGSNGGGQCARRAENAVLFEGSDISGSF